MKPVLSIILLVSLVLLAIPMFALGIPTHSTSPVYSPDSSSYSFTINETGLPSGGKWSAEFYLLSNYSWYTQTTTANHITWTDNVGGTHQYDVYQTVVNGKIYTPSMSAHPSDVILIYASTYQTIQFTNQSASPNGSLNSFYALSIHIYGAAGQTGAATWHGFITDNQSLYYSISTNSKYISFQVPNGTYYFQVNATASWTPSPSHGFITIRGANYSISIYVANNYTGLPVGIFFVATGILNGSTWYLDFNGTEYNLTVHHANVPNYFEDIEVIATAGKSYNFSVNATNYSYSGPASVLISTSGQTVYLDFQLTNESGPSHFLSEGLALIGISVISFWTVLMAAVAIIGIIVCVWLDAPIYVTIAVPVLVLFMGYGFNVIGILVPAVSPFAGAAAYYLEKKEPGGERGR